MSAARHGVLVDSLLGREKTTLEVKHARKRQRRLLPAATPAALLIDTVPLVIAMIHALVVVGWGGGVALVTGYDESARVDSSELPHVRLEQP